MFRTCFEFYIFGNIVVSGANAHLCQCRVYDLRFVVWGVLIVCAARVRQQRESFSTRVVFLNLVSRLVSHHKVLLLSLYPYLERYLKPSQRLVPSLLAIAANSVHAAVPPDEVKPLLKTIADNFVSDTRGEEVVTLGLNAVNPKH